MNNTIAHQKLVDDVLFHIGSTKYCRVWKQVNGVFKTVHGDRTVRVGLPGMADISGIIFRTGKRLEIECKTGSGALTKDQKKWQAMILAYDGIYICARDYENPLQLVKHLAGF